MNKTQTIIICLLLFISAYVFARSCRSINHTTSTIKTCVGKDLTITLQANATTGYQWQTAEPVDEKIIKFKKSEHKPYKTGLIGSPGQEIWTFKTVGAGRTTLSFKYVRPWERDVKPVKTGKFTIIVNRR